MMFASVIALFILSCFSTFVVEVKGAKRILEDKAEITGVLRNFIGRGDPLALFLDFDGTLSPIVNHAKDAKMHKDSKKALDNLLGKNNVRLAIVSGRSATDAKGKVTYEVTYAGNHGLEIHYPNDRKPVYKHLKDNSPHMRAYRKLINDLNAGIEKPEWKGAWVEPKGYSIAVHYRLVSSDNAKSAVMAEAHRIVSTSTSGLWKSDDGDQVVDVKPNIPWNKGSAVDKIWREEFGYNMKAIYIGDDKTDEDAFQKLQERTNTLSIRVINTQSNAQRITNADYCVRSWNEVPLILEAIYEIL